MNDISKEASLSKLFSLKTFPSTVFENPSKSLILQHCERGKRDSCNCSRFFERASLLNLSSLHSHKWDFIAVFKQCEGWWWLIDESFSTGKHWRMVGLSTVRQSFLHVRHSHQGRKFLAQVAFDIRDKVAQILRIDLTRWNLSEKNEKNRVQFLESQKLPRHVEIQYFWFAWKVAKNGDQKETRRTRYPQLRLSRSNPPVRGWWIPRPQDTSPKVRLSTSWWCLHSPGYFLQVWAIWGWLTLHLYGSLLSSKERRKKSFLLWK